MDLKETQDNLPWGADGHGYSEQYNADKRPHRDIEHALMHAGLALADAHRAVNDVAAHVGFGNREATTKALCDVMWNILRAANVFPGGAIDLDRSLAARFVSKFPGLMQKYGVDGLGRFVDGKGRYLAIHHDGCAADDDGDCNWAACPQLRDNEPKTSGRSCARSKKTDE